MLIIPAIDLKDGKCVRLIQGDPDRATIYSSDPVSIAQKFESDGAKLIHIVDLDGAFSGELVNFDLVKKISESVKIPIEIGGGIRTEDSIKKYIDTGIKRIIVGTVLLKDEFRETIKKYSDYIVAGVDAKDGMAATHGWKSVSRIPAIEVIRKFQAEGIKNFIFTDIATDGMLTGPNIKSMAEILQKAQGIDLIASGGVTKIEDIISLSELENSGLSGCIVGKAIYDGRIELREAINRLTSSAHLIS
jgi:phosphoribosylformimino-5-aminoimidazole carboxamide ribotide isomerase